MKYNVLIQDFNSRKFVPYDIFPYLYRQYNEKEQKPLTIQQYKDFILSEARYQWWARCEYEIIVSGWPNVNNHKKIDVYEQIALNIDAITTLFMEYVDINKANTEIYTE